MKVEDSHGGLAGRSILEMIWEKLDLAYAALQQHAARMDDDPEPSIARETLAALKSECKGLATAIAIMTNPYEPSVPDVSKQAGERYTAALAAA